MKTVKVKAYKKLGPTGKIENVDAHLRNIGNAKKYAMVEFDGTRMSGKFDESGNKLTNLKKPSLFLSMGPDVKIIKTFKTKKGLQSFTK